MDFSFGTDDTSGGLSDWGAVVNASQTPIPGATAPGVGGSGYSYDSSTWDTFGIDPAPDPSPYDENPNTISSVLGSIGTTAATSVPGGIDVLVAVTKPGGLQTWWDTFTSQLGAQANAASKAAASVQKRQVLDAKSGASASTVLVLGSLAVVGVLIFSFSKGR